MFDLLFMLILLGSLFNYLCSGCLRGGQEREREKQVMGLEKG